MNTFDEREASEEKRFALDEERRFRVRVARDRAMAAWAADWLAIPAAGRAAFSEDFVRGNVGRSDESAAADLARRFAEAGRPIEAERLRRKFAAAHAEAESLR